MTQAATPSRHDFHDPRRLPPSAWKALNQWTRDAFHLTQETWQPTLLSPVTIEVDGVDPLEVREALGLAPSPGLGVHVRIGNAGLPGLLAMSRRQAIGLLADMLGDRITEWPEPRDLTDLEESLLGMLFQQFAHALSETWPGARTVPAVFDSSVDRPHRTRLFAPDATLIMVRIRMTSRFGAEDAFWFLPMEEIEQLIRTEGSATESAAGAPSAILEDLALDLPVSLVAELGRTRIKMSEIAALRVGDVIVLDQSISRSLPVYVGDRVKFRAQPGRVGARQALVIESSAGETRE